MKKIAKFMFIAVVAVFAVVSCGKNASPTPDPTPDPQPEPEPEPAVEVKLAIDGKFDEWKDITPVAGEGAILFSKTQVDENKLYFYFEADMALLEAESYAYANYLHLCLDCNGEGAESTTYWGGEEGATYDVLYQIWLMQSGQARMAQWYDGVSTAAKIENGVYKAELSIARSANELFSGNIMFYGIYVTDQACDTSSGSEEWLPGDMVGIAPAEGEDMAKLK